MNIGVYIERLVLDGLSIPYSQRELLQQAVEAELTRLLTEGGLAEVLSSSGAVPSLSVPTIHLSQDGDPTRLGAQVAQTVYSGLNQPSDAERRR